MRLSFSSLNMLHEASHQWTNKMMGIKIPDYDFLREGKEAHRLIQLHVSGKKKHKYLKHIEIKFPIVEEVDFDERCRFSFPVKTDKGEYEIIGFYDGLDIKNHRILEIKSSSTPWSLGKFHSSMQRKLYGLSNFKIKEAFLITGSRNPDDWEKNPPKIYSIPFKPRDYSEATKWIFDGINIILKGDFTGGLDEDGKCTGCFYGKNCSFV